MEIRPAAIEDAEAIASIKRQEGVREGVLSLSSERTSVTEEELKRLTSRDRAFVAVEDGRVVGYAVMKTVKDPIRRHCANIFVMADRDFQRRGIGYALSKRLVECADGELGLHRLEILVLTDNERAVRLYKSLGFMIEATKQRAAVVRGRYVNEYLMGRLAGEEARAI